MDQFRDEVYYEGRLVLGADISSFEDLGFGYGKDRNHVYRFGEILEYVDPSTFRVDSRFSAGEKHDRPFHGTLGNPSKYHHGYYKTSFDVYWCGEIIERAMSSTFKVTSGGYAEDAFNTYFKGRKLE